MPLLWVEARKQADLLRREFADRRGFVDPYAVCEALGISVLTTELPPKVSGMIVKEAEEDAEVLIASQEPQPRQRFTLAHELGHFIERTRLTQDPEFSFRDSRSTKYTLHEFFADEFAGALLMPNPQFSIDVKRMDDIALAKKYGVSPAAVEKRRVRLEKNPDRG